MGQSESASADFSQAGGTHAQDNAWEQTDVSQAGSAFSEAFKDDSATWEGIQKVVAEIETHGTNASKKQADPEKVKKAKEQAAVAKQLEEKLAKRAEVVAQRWIKQETTQKGSQPFVDEASDAFDPMPRPKPMVLDWQCHALDTFLENVLVEDAWNDARLGPLLREFLDRLKHDPAGQHGIHPQLAELFRDPEVELLLASLRKEKGVAPKVQIAQGPAPEFYALLGVDVDATFEEIKKGYRKEALRWHPDKNENKSEATHRFQKINEAFDTLFDPQKRESYDSGVADLPKKAKKLQGHGWANFPDEDDNVLTKEGLRAKMRSWRNYYNMNGRIDDKPEDLVFDKDDPRYPQIRIMCFWRWLGELAWEASDREGWLGEFVKMIWKDTPSHWPKTDELKNMSEAARSEWKERRMVYNRRKHKVRLHMSLHEDYLNIPDREEKERARIAQMFPSRAESMKLVS